MRDEEDPGEGPAVECREPGLAEARGQHDEACAVARMPRRRQRGQGGALDGVRLGRRRVRFIRHDALREIGQWCGAAPVGIGGDPVGGQRPRLRMGKQRLEGRGDNIGGAFGVKVPFDAAGQRRPRQVRAADDRRPLPVGGAEEPGLRMERPGAGFEHPQLCAVEIGQPMQRRRLGHVHVVADDDPEPAAAGEQVAEPRLDQLDAGLHGEGHRQIDAVGPVDSFCDQRQQGVIGAGGEAAGATLRLAQNEVAVLDRDVESLDAGGQCFSHSRQQLELLRRGQIRPAPDMPRRGQRAGRLADRAIGQRIGQGQTSSATPGYGFSPGCPGGETPNLPARGLASYGGQAAWDGRVDSGGQRGPSP